jgi:hypothetical protein
LLVCNWPHSIGQNHFFAMMLFNRDSAILSAFKDSAQFTSQKIWFPASRSDDVSYRSDAQLSKASSVQTTRTFRLTFLCVEKLRTALACIRLDVLAARPDDSQCLTSLRISFQNRVMGRSLQPSGRRRFPSGRAHPYGKYRIQNPDVRTPVSMVQTHEH